MDSVLPLIERLRELSGKAQADADDTFYFRVRDDVASKMLETALAGRSAITFTGQARNTPTVTLMLMRLKDNLEKAGYTTLIDIDLHGPTNPLDYVFTVGW